MCSHTLYFIIPYGKCKEIYRILSNGAQPHRVLVKSYKKIYKNCLKNPLYKYKKVWYNSVYNQNGVICTNDAKGNCFE